MPSQNELVIEREESNTTFLMAAPSEHTNNVICYEEDFTTRPLIVALPIKYTLEAVRAVSDRQKLLREVSIRKVNASTNGAQWPLYNLFQRPHALWTLTPAAPGTMTQGARHSAKRSTAFSFNFSYFTLHLFIFNIILQFNKFISCFSP